MKEEKEEEDKEKEENVEEQQNTADASKEQDQTQKADDSEKKDDVKKTEVGRGVKKKGPLLSGMDGGSFKRRRETARQAALEEPGDWGSQSKMLAQPFNQFQSSSNLSSNLNSNLVPIAL